MAALQPGQMLDGTSYQVVRQLGAGGMGVVYEIEHVRLKKRYVAKVMHESFRNDEAAFKRMEREAQVLAAITHPNVVQVHDFGTTRDGVHYFVMEKLEGVDLRGAMAAPMPRARALGIVADVLDALDYVHKRGIVHRDIKPENIFLAEQPQGTVTKVLDFGIAHIFDADGRISHARITKTGGFTGTLYYAAPEQMQGKPTGPATDVYAAGLVLFELLAGKGPFDDDPGVGLSRCFKPAPRLTEIVRIPTEVSDAVAGALEQDPAARPAAGTLAATLRRLASLPNLASAGDNDVPPSPDVDELLRAMPVHTSAAAPEGALPASIVGPDTAAPATPVMQGSPPRPAAASEEIQPTVASPGIAPGMSTPGPIPSPMAAPAPGRQLHSTPVRPGSSPGVPPFAAPTPSPAHAASMPSSPAMTPVRASTPHAPARGDTSPGLYATVDSVPAGVPRATPAWAPFAAVGAAVVLVGGLVTGAVLYKRSVTAAATSPVATANAEAASSAATGVVPSGVAGDAPAAESASGSPAADAGTSPGADDAKPSTNAESTTAPTATGAEASGAGAISPTPTSTSTSTLPSRGQPPSPSPTSVSKVQPAHGPARPAGSATAAQGGYFREL